MAHPSKASAAITGRFGCAASQMPSNLLVKLCTAFVLLFLAITATAQPDDLETLSKLNQQIKQLYWTGRYQEAIPLGKKSLAIAEKALGSEHPQTATSLNNLAELYDATGDYAQAEPLLKRALAIRERALGPDHQQTALSLNNLAALYYATGAYAQAGPLYKRALEIREKVLGPDHPDTANSLNNLAELYNATGDYAQAGPLYTRALAIVEKTFGLDHPYTAITINNLAAFYYATGNFAKAEPLYKRALAINEKRLGPEHPNTAISLSSLAELYQATGDYAQAEPLYKRALAINEKQLGPEHPNTAISLGRLAGLYQATGDYTQAGPLYKRALAINEKALGPEHPYTANSLSNLAGFYQATDDYAQAAPLFKRALAINEKALGPEHPYTANSLSNLAGLYQVSGDYAQAEPLYKRALAIREKALGPEHTQTASSLNNLAALYNATGDYAKAEPLLKRALKIYEKVLGQDHPGTAHSLNNLAVLYITTGDYAEAGPLLVRAQSIIEKTLGPDHPDTAHILNTLAAFYKANGDYAKAEPLLKRALAINEKALGPEHTQTAITLGSLAGLYQTTGSNAQAESLYKRALAIREKTLGPEHPDTASALNNLAAFYHATSAYAKAEPLLKRALAIREKVLGSEHPDTAMSLYNLAILDWEQDQWGIAADEIRHAIQASESVTRNVLVMGDEARKRAFATTLVGETYVVVTFAMAARDRIKDAASLGMQLVLQRKGRVLDVMANNLAAMRASLSQQDRQLLDEWQQSNSEYATLLFRGPEKIPNTMYRALLDELRGKSQALEAQLSERSQAFRNRTETATVERVQRMIPQGTALLEWFRYRPFIPPTKGNEPKWGTPRYVAYVLKREGTPVAVELGEAAPIEKTLSDFLAQLQDQQGTRVDELARELDGRLMQPLRPYLGDAKRLLISPDGQLNLLPFGALMDERGHYLIQSTEITYLTSGRDLLREADMQESGQPPVVVANPDFGLQAKALADADRDESNRRSADMRLGSFQFKPLNGTAEEAQAIKHLFKLSNDEVLTGSKATETEIKALKSPRILHIATHGFFLADEAIDPETNSRAGLGEIAAAPPLRENPMLRSGLALAGANQLHSGNDDGLLTALEVSGLDLAGTELVVLSACDSGNGQVENGEGVYGLRRALVLAGAQTQVDSLWKVDDKATMDLMVDYYKRLATGAGRSEALRQAQLEMLAKPQRAHPFYWAAFVAIGSDAPLKH